MGTDKPQTGTVARRAEKLARLELAFVEAAQPAHDSAEGLRDRVLAEAIERVALERKTSGQVIAPVADLAQEISVPAIVLAVGQQPTA